MNRKMTLRVVVTVVVTVTLFVLYWAAESALAQVPAGAGPAGGSPTETFSYQGRLMDSGRPASGSYDLRFALFTADVLGIQMGSTMTYTSWPVTDGVFSVNLAPGLMNTVFDGGPLWIQADVRPGGSAGAFTALPRQPITASPYAWGLRAGAVVSGPPSSGTTGWVLQGSLDAGYPSASAIQGVAATGAAISGESISGNAISGSTEDGYAVRGYDGGAANGRGYGGYFYSANGVGVYGQSDASRYFTNMYAPGVYGKSSQGIGVYGVSAGAGMAGVRGESADGYGVTGQSATGTGVAGWTTTGTGTVYGVYGSTYSTAGQGGHFVNTNQVSPGTQAGIWVGTYWGNLIEGHEINAGGTSVNRRFRVVWDGTVYSDGSYNCGLGSGCFNTGIGADVAERIDVTMLLEPGDVVEIDPEADGRFRKSATAFSTLAAGVVSTNPAITMNNNDLSDTGSAAGSDKRPLLALNGTVPVKVSAENGPIRRGDLLVTSATAGHAMRAGANPPTGTVIGKALENWDQGAGVIKMLATLQ